MARDKNPKLAWWQKFHLDSHLVTNLRSMLDLADDEDFPAVLWIVMGLHRALERRFVHVPWSARDLAQMVIESQILVPTLRNATKWIPGDMVMVTTLQREGAYWHPGPCGKHLINCHGDLHLVEPEDIEAPESAVRDSDLNKAAKVGARLIAGAPQAVLANA
jgi:hypothetical protein